MRKALIFRVFVLFVCIFVFKSLLRPPKLKCECIDMLSGSTHAVLFVLPF
jgi:hypothetical protein